MLTEQRNGTSGADTINGGDYNDNIRGGAGNDSLTGGAGNDTIDGGDGNDRIDLRADSGVTVANGNRNADTILGGDAGEVLRGGKGHDSIDGGAGNDLIYGGQGNDTLAGGSGVDFFLFEASSGADVITDFQTGTDKLFISSNANGNGIFSAEQVLAAAVNSSGNVVIALGGENSVTLQGVALVDLTVADFAVA